MELVVEGGTTKTKVGSAELTHVLHYVYTRENPSRKPKHVRRAIRLCGRYSKYDGIK